VSKITDYGAVVRLSEGRTGLIHISEIADAFVRDVREYLSLEDEVTVRIVRIDSRGRIDLSMKPCDGGAAPDNVRGSKPDAYGSRARTSVGFEEKLSKFLKDSQESHHDLKRHMEHHRRK